MSQIAAIVRLKNLNLINSLFLFFTVGKLLADILLQRFEIILPDIYPEILTRISIWKIRLMESSWCTVIGEDERVAP